MNRSRCIALMVIAGLGLGSISNVLGASGTDQMVAEANNSIAVAASAVEEARASIANAKELLAMIPADSPLINEVTKMLGAAKENWAMAVSALDGAKSSASKIASATSAEIAQDYKLLASVNASVAVSGAKVVQTGMLYIDAAANDRTEALDIIRTAMDDSLEAAAQVQLNYERVKGFIADKYSK